ncbi:hypothetical protein Tco_1344442 [Tanacetum coccineum]
MFQGIVDIVVIEGLLMKKDIDETGHVMIRHELFVICLFQTFVEFIGMSQAYSYSGGHVVHKLGVLAKKIIMANLPPPNHVADLPEDDPEEQPKLAPEPDHLNEFALHQIPQPEGNMNGWILENDEEEEEEEDPEMEEEIEEENDDDDAEIINPYEEADPLNLPPPDSDTESEDRIDYCHHKTCASLSG